MLQGRVGLVRFHPAGLFLLTRQRFNLPEKPGPDGPVTSARVAHRVPCTEAEGPGKRYALWFQGCPLRCAGCCNPHFLSFSGGELIPLDTLRAEISQAIQEHGIEGITLLGGEPTAQPDASSALLEHAHSLGLNTLVFSGHTVEELRARKNPSVDSMLARTDWLVDGPYDHTQPESIRRFIGSANQRLLTLSDRVRANDPRWLGSNTLEIRMKNGTIEVNGFPTASLESLGPWLGKGAGQPQP
ncbi:MAG: 4Fe-4S single cluster domain-containing protein [Gemmataceae bacterium]